MITSAIKKQTSECCSILLYPYGITNLESKKEKKKGILLLAYIADVSLTNRSFYMRTLSLRQIRSSSRDKMR